MKFAEFAEWIINEVRVGGVAMTHTSSAGRDIGRIANDVVAQIIYQNEGWEMEVTAIDSKEDKLGTDGYFRSGPLKGKSAQIIRRIAENSHDDFAIKIVGKQADPNNIYGQDVQALMQAYPAKLSQEANIHVMLNAADNTIFLADITTIRERVDQAIAEMKQDPRYNGMFTERNSFVSRNNGVNLRVAKSYEGYCILAYVPAQNVSFQIIRTSPEQVQSIESTIQGPKRATVGSPAQQVPQAPVQQGPQINPTWVSAMDQALATGQSSFPAPNNKKRIKPFQRFASKRGIMVTLQGNQVILVKKAA